MYELNHTKTSNINKNIQSNFKILLFTTHETFLAL